MKKNSKKPKSKHNVLSTDEIQSIKSSIKNNREKLIFYSLIYTGMRVSELIHMKKDWLYIRKGFIHIPESQECPCYECKKELKYRKSGNIRKPSGVWMPKTEDGSRIIKILPELDELLNKYFEEHDSIMEIAPNRVSVWRLLKELGKRAEIKHNLFPHAIRATFATILAEENIDIYTLKDIMGWKDINVAASYVKFSGIKVAKEFKRIKRKW